jgi:KDO2-lipid IV(A) lauroyltransferase
MASRRQVLNRIGHIALDLALHHFGTLDIARAERKGRTIGRLAFRLDRKHRERTYANLALAFPTWSAAEYDRVARGVFDHFGIVIGDFLHSPARTNEDLLANTTVEGSDNMFEAEDCAKGIVAVSGHFGNWERFGHYSTARGRLISVVARPSQDGGLEDRVLRLREGAGLKVISRGNSIKQIMGVLRGGGTVALLPDQNSDECFVPFFGQPCGSVLGPAVLHLRTGATLIPAFCVRTGVGKYHVRVHPSVNPDGKEKDPVAITATLNRILEDEVRQHPEQWLWMHDRWKSARRKGMLV